MNLSELVLFVIIVLNNLEGLKLLTKDLSTNSSTPYCMYMLQLQLDLETDPVKVEYALVFLCVFYL